MSNQVPIPLAGPYTSFTFDQSVLQSPLIAGIAGRSSNLFPYFGALIPAYVGVAYSETVSVNGGTAPYTFSLVSGSLPAGLSLNTSTGVISGTPTATGTSTFQVKIVDTYGLSGQTTFSLEVDSVALDVYSPSLPNGNVGAAYSATMSASGGTAPYTFAVTAGSLPTGLSLNTSTGVISGTPTVVATSTFTITATDAHSVTGSEPFSITIAAPTVVVNSTNLPGGTVGTSYTGSVLATGGTAPYTYSVISGSLPVGLSLNSSTGAITGTPTISGSSSFTVQAVGSLGNSGSSPFTIAIALPAGGNSAWVG